LTLVAEALEAAVGELDPGAVALVVELDVDLGGGGPQRGAPRERDRARRNSSPSTNRS
jgi:hypothetical protein